MRTMQLECMHEPDFLCPMLPDCRHAGEVHSRGAKFQLGDTNLQLPLVHGAMIVFSPDVTHGTIAGGEFVPGARRMSALPPWCCKP